MKHHHLLSACALAALTLTLTGCRSSQNVSTALFERTEVFGPGDDGSKFYRIPALATAADGSLIAIADKRWDNLGDLPEHIDAVCRRSTDNGHTWSAPVTIAGEGTRVGYGDVAVVLDEQNGQLLTLITSGTGLWQSRRGTDEVQKILVSISKDNGQTWSQPRDITPQIYGPGCPDAERSQWHGAFVSSGSALQLSTGRLMAVTPIRKSADWGGKLATYVIYSDDHGLSWQVSENPGDEDGDESKVVELENGDVLMSIRNRHQGTRKFSISHDGGRTWSEPWLQHDITEPACNGDIISYQPRRGQRMLLHTIPFDAKVRRNVSLLGSTDDGKTWTLRRSFGKQMAAYSSLTVLKDGTIGCLIEEGQYDDHGFNIYFYRLSPDWLLQ